MDQHQQDVRRAAAKAFLDSLSQLENSLQSVDDTAQNALPVPVLDNPVTQRSTAAQLNLVQQVQQVQQPEAQSRDGLEDNPESYVEALAEAAADIEQFINSQP